jgi:hypothetical protein
MVAKAYPDVGLNYIITGVTKPAQVEDSDGNYVPSPKPGGTERRWQPSQR